MPGWGLVTYRVGQEDRPGLLVDGRIADAERAARAPQRSPADGRLTALAILDQWDTWRPLLDDAAGRLRSADAGVWAPQGARLRAPILYPRKLLCAGANYTDHLEEMSAFLKLDALKPFDKTTRKPFFFLKPSTNTVIGPDEEIRLPPEGDVDWEVELAAVIGRAGRNVSVARAAEHIAGYTVLLDISGRGPLHFRADWADPFRIDWLQAKGLDTFAPMGPCVIPRDQVPDAYALRISLSVNGEMMQDSNTSKLIYTVEEQIAHLSTLVTLEPGDVIATGTPAGVGLPRGRFLRRGDVVIGEVEGIGSLRNPVV